LYNGFYLILTHSFLASKCPLHLNTITPHFPHLDQKHWAAHGSRCFCVVAQRCKETPLPLKP
jgi:hypothetical protein